MRPIPLAAPDGQIYAYACSHCRHVGGGSTLLCPPASDGPHPQLVESSHRDATNCCICHTCGALIELETWGGIRCASCQDWDSLTRFWWNLGVAVSEGISTPSEWAKYCNFDDDDLDDNDEIPGDDRSHDPPAGP